MHKYGEPLTAFCYRFSFHSSCWYRTIVHQSPLGYDNIQWGLMAPGNPHETLHSSCQKSAQHGTSSVITFVINYILFCEIFGWSGMAIWFDQFCVIACKRHITCHVNCPHLSEWQTKLPSACTTSTLLCLYVNSTEKIFRSSESTTTTHFSDGTCNFCFLDLGTYTYEPPISSAHFWQCFGFQALEYELPQFEHWLVPRDVYLEYLSCQKKLNFMLLKGVL